MRTWADTPAAGVVWWGYGTVPHSATMANMVLGLEEVKRAGLEAPVLDQARSVLAGLLRLRASAR